MLMIWFVQGLSTHFRSLGGVSVACPVVHIVWLWLNISNIRLAFLNTRVCCRACSVTWFHPTQVVCTGCCDRSCDTAESCNYWKDDGTEMSCSCEVGDEDCILEPTCSVNSVNNELLCL